MTGSQGGSNKGTVSEEQITTRLVPSWSNDLGDMTWTMVHLPSWLETLHSIASKLRNKRMKSYNGNRAIRNIIQIDHWNAGNAKWQNKITEIEAVLLAKKPDILFVSEANLYDTLPIYMRQITGYELHFPEKMMEKHKYVRLVMLAKEGMEIELHPEWMHEDLSIIWASVQYSTRKKMRVGGVYREHRLLLQPQPNLTVSPMAQNIRWNQIINSWKLASRDVMCTLVGDTNLDYLKWGHPEDSHRRMVERQGMKWRQRASHK